MLALGMFRLGFVIFLMFSFILLTAQTSKARSADLGPL